MRRDLTGDLAGLAAVPLTYREVGATRAETLPVTETDRCGFAYGTLPGHPERGEESFLVGMAETGDVRFRIRAFSRPASLMARAGGPLSRRVQQYATDRYVAALRRLAQGDTDSRSAML